MPLDDPQVQAASPPPHTQQNSIQRSPRRLRTLAALTSSAGIFGASISRGFLIIFCSASCLGEYGLQWSDIISGILPTGESEAEFRPERAAIDL